MPFRFRLQKVLDHRQRLVDQQSRRVSEATQKLSAVETSIKSLHLEITQVINPTQMIETGLKTEYLNQRRNWLEHLDLRLEQLEGDRQKATGELAEQREKLTETWRDLEVLKKLKLKQKEAWEHEIFRRENQDLDEIGQIRADRMAREKVAPG